MLLTPKRSRRSPLLSSNVSVPCTSLCNNAGVFQAGRAWEATDEEWRWAFDVNVFGIINGIRSFVPRMLDGGDHGHVVNTASVAGFVAAPLNGPYTASKTAALSVTECLAHDLQSVNARIGASVFSPVGDPHRHRPYRCRSAPTAWLRSPNSPPGSVTSSSTSPMRVSTRLRCHPSSSRRSRPVTS